MLKAGKANSCLPFKKSGAKIRGKNFFTLSKFGVLLRRNQTDQFYSSSGIFSVLLFRAFFIQPKIHFNIFSFKVTGV